jgi:hypothetical protein
MKRNRIGRLAIALIAIAALGGCVVYPYGRVRGYYVEGGWHGGPR